MQGEVIMNTPEEIFTQLQDILVEMFEIDRAKITPTAQLYDDLDIDSIDAVDLVIKLKELTGKKVTPEDFKSVRNVQDVVEAIQRLTD